jgi:hypothetical protein
MRVSQFISPLPRSAQKSGTYTMCFFLGEGNELCERLAYYRHVSSSPLLLVNLHDDNKTIKQQRVNIFCSSDSDCLC